MIHQHDEDYYGETSNGSMLDPEACHDHWGVSHGSPFIKPI